jgi:hypothetical protein
MLSHGVQYLINNKLHINVTTTKTKQDEEEQEE